MKRSCRETMELSCGKVKGHGFTGAGVVITSLHRRRGL